MNWNFDSSTQHSDPICDFQCDSKWQSSSSNRLYGNNELEIPALVRTLEPQCDQSSSHLWTLKAVFCDLFCLGGPKSFKMFKSLGLRCRRHTCKVVLLTSLAWCFLDLLILMTYSGVVAWQAVFLDKVNKLVRLSNAQKMCFVLDEEFCTGWNDVELFFPYGPFINAIVLKCVKIHWIVPM